MRLTGFFLGVIVMPQNREVSRILLRATLVYIAIAVTLLWLLSILDSFIPCSSRLLLKIIFILKMSIGISLLCVPFAYFRKI